MAKPHGLGVLDVGRTACAPGARASATQRVGARRAGPRLGPGCSPGTTARCGPARRRRRWSSGGPEAGVVELLPGDGHRDGAPGRPRIAKGATAVRAWAVALPVEVEPLAAVFLAGGGGQPVRVLG